MEPSSRDRLRKLVDSLPDDLIAPAISLLSRLEDDDPLTPEESANLESAAEDRRLGRMVSIDDYERQRGL